MKNLLYGRGIILREPIDLINGQGEIGQRDKRCVVKHHGKFSAYSTKEGWLFGFGIGIEDQ